MKRLSIRTSKRTKGVLALTLLLLQSLPAIATKRHDRHLSVAPAPLPPQAATQVAYSSYLGGNHADEARALATDAAGNFYVAGSTNSSNFPVANAAHAEFHGPVSIEDAFVAKFSAAGMLLYSTYLGGTGADFATGVTVDANGQAYVSGRTTSPDFPVSGGALRSTIGGEDAFIIKLSPAGAVLYATLLGGGGVDRSTSIAVDAAGNAYVTGKTTSLDFPTTPGAAQRQLRGFEDAFVARVNAGGTELLYSTYLGGTSNLDEGYGIAVDAAGLAYIAGGTASADFPTLNALQPVYGGGSVFFGDGFVTKLSASGAILYSTYLGGARGDQANDVAVDADGYAYLTGVTDSTNFPTRNAVQGAKAGDCSDAFSNCLDAFVARLDPTGSQLIFSTYLGGCSRSTTVNDAGDAGASISADASGNAYVTGTTASSDFPTVRASQPLRGGNGDAFLTKVSAAGAIVYSTYVGGVGDESAHAVAGDSAGGAYLVGIATSPGFPTTPGAFQLSFAGSYESLSLARDGFVVRLTDDTPNQPQLRITGARVSGKKLFVSGENFAFGALLFVNGEKQKKSANDDLSPTTLLVARKSGKWIPAGQAVTLEVKNPDGSTSPPFLYRRPD